jgi:hypothetical protein
MQHKDKPTDVNIVVEKIGDFVAYTEEPTGLTMTAHESDLVPLHEAV